MRELIKIAEELLNISEDVLKFASIEEVEDLIRDYRIEKSDQVAIVWELPLCDICKEEDKVTIARFDAKMAFDEGSWGYLCREHFENYSYGKLSLGYGQLLITLEEARELADKYDFIRRKLSSLEKNIKKIMGTNDDLLRLSKESFYKRGQGESDLINKWYNIGIEAGKEEDFMNLEDFSSADLLLSEDEVEVIISAIERWKNTDHYKMTYERKMWFDVVDEVRREGVLDYDEAFKLYYDLEYAFWDGYIRGRKEGKGIDIYREAREALKRYKES